MKSADSFIELIREIIRDETANQDQTVVCIIQSVNLDETLNVYVLPDRSTIIPNIINASKYQFVSGDAAVLYKIKNQMNNAFVIAKYNPF